MTTETQPHGGVTREIGTLSGQTRTVMVPGPDGPVRLDVTVNVDVAGRPREVFASYPLPGVAGHHALLDAVCRLTSRLLQAAVPVPEAVRMLKGQADAWAPVRWSDGTLILSVADAIGRVLEAEGAEAPPAPETR